jgi:RNA polymerase sigma factor (sigma-70 family)
MEDLAERIRNGDRSAERDLVDLFYGRIFAMAMARTRDRETSLDLVQEIMLAVLSALREGRLREPAALPGYVSTTARNRISYFFRQSGRKPTEPLLSAESSLPSPEESTRRQERLRLAHRAIKQLNPAEQRILRLTFVEGLTAREIGARLGLEPEAVRKRKSRALRKARGFLKKGTSRSRL